MLIVTNWKALNIDINDSSMYEVKNGHFRGSLCKVRKEKST